MFLAKILPGREPIVTKVTDYVISIQSSGKTVKQPREPWARKIIGGGAAALGRTQAGAIASARCVLEQDKAERELRNKRDRA